MAFDPHSPKVTLDGVELKYLRYKLTKEKGYFPVLTYTDIDGVEHKVLCKEQRLYGPMDIRLERLVPEGVDVRPVFTTGEPPGPYDRVGDTKALEMRPIRIDPTPF